MMNQFFYGWRRKVGCITLVMAGAMVIAWCASLRSLIQGHLAMSDSSEIMAVAGDGCFTVIVFNNASLCYSVVNWGSSPDPQAIYRYERDDYAWLLRSPHLRYGREVGKKGSITTVSIAFTLIVIPLTLLSTYLIPCPGKRKGKHP